MSDDTIIRLPQLGLTMTEGMVVEWLVAPGAAVSAGDLLCIVETDKIANEILADRDGVLEAILVHADETVPVGATLGVWADGSESRAAPGPKSASPPLAASNAATAQVADSGSTKTKSQRIIATPRARKLARDHDVELSDVTGSGPQGRIVAADVLKSSNSGSSADHRPLVEADLGEPLRGAKKVIAGRMLQSQQQIPHFYLTANAEISELLWLHENLKQKPDLEQLTLTHWIASAVGLVIARTPLFRTICQDDRLYTLPDSDVAIAVSSDDKLYAPVARDLGTHGLAENTAQIHQLVQQVRSGGISGEAMSGGATTISNLGGFNIHQVFPLINPGQSSILGVGRQQSIFRPDDDGAAELNRDLALVLACDHRVFNGTDGARMLQAIVDLLEDPLLLITRARR